LSRLLKQNTKFFFRQDTVLSFDTLMHAEIAISGRDNISACRESYMAEKAISAQR